MSKSTNQTIAAHIVVVGAGQIGTPVVERLARAGTRVSWLSRTRPAHVPAGATHVAVDARDANAVAALAQGAQAMIVAVNPATYDAKVWAETLPPLHAALIDAAARAGTRLVVLDALYLYATDQGPLSPATPTRPTTEKGKVRLQLAEMLKEAQRAGRVRATTLRAPDFWGPGLHSALLTEASIAGLKQGKRPFLVGNPDVLHAFSHRDDVVEALITLARAPADVEGQVFHAPVIHITPRELVKAFAEAQGAQVAPFVAPRWLLRLVGLFSRTTRGMLEMLPQWERPYLVDDGSFRLRFGVEATALVDGVARALPHAP